MECRNKIEDKKREEVEASTWCGRSVSPNKTSNNSELTHPLYSEHDYRIKTSTVKTQTQQSSKTNSISHNTWVLRRLRMLTRSVDYVSRHQEPRINAALGARNVVGIRATGVVEAYTTSKTAGTRARTNK